jgi:hypothetical protein
MASATEEHLRQLRQGDRVKYHGVLWRIEDYSTYTDENGYETEEWLLRSQTGKEYYLMRELDPQNAEGLVHWYIAEELGNPSIYEPESSRELTFHLGEDMRSGRDPYPEIRMFNRAYQFESQTQGEYESRGRTRTRITWDYWDPPHLWNLALEAWSDGTLSVYSTREVQPADFTDAKRSTGLQMVGSLAAPVLSKGQSFESESSRNGELAFAVILIFIGFCLMISGI